MQAPVTQVKEWRTAYSIAFANAFIFLFLALTMFLLQPSSLAVILSVPALFSLGALLSFLMMVRSSGVCTAIAWFMLGAGIFFGMGVVVGGVYPNSASAHSLSESILHRDLIRVNLLNACSVFIVLAVAYPLVTMRGREAINQTMPSDNVVHLLLKLFPLVVAIATIGVGLKFVLFPFAENLVLRSMVSALYLSIPFCLFLLGMLWQYLGRHLQVIAVSVVFLEVLNGLLNFNKLQIISAILALVIGAWVGRHTIRFLAITLIMVAAVFAVLNPVVNSGRAHINYNPTTNSVATRLAVIADVVLGRPSDAGTVGSGLTTGAVSAKLAPSLTRFSVPFIQGYLIDEYENGRAGNSLDDFWAAMVPRVLWPDKPNITRFGPQLYAQYYKHPPTSSLAPTYSAEAYWNHGPAGVVFISILLGLEFGWLTLRSQLAMAGRDPAFFLIAAPVAIWAIQVEAWVAATYIGGFLTFLVIWLVARFAFLRYRPV